MGKFSILCIAAAMAALAGCTVSKDFNFSVEKDFVINNYNSISYQSSDTVDAAQSSSDFNTYKSELESVEIQSASYTVTYFSGPLSQTINSATVTVGALDASSSKVLATMSNVNLSSVAAISQPLMLTTDGKQFFQDQLKGSTSSAVITFAATANQAPLTFTVRFHFDIKGTYSKSLF